MPLATATEPAVSDPGDTVSAPVLARGPLGPTGPVGPVGPAVTPGAVAPPVGSRLALATPGRATRPAQMPATAHRMAERARTTRELLCRCLRGELSGSRFVR